MTVAAYIRISSKSQNIESQREAINKWCASHGIRGNDVQWFEDVETGSHLDRPAFKQLETALFHGEIRTVIVFKLDRLARSIQDGINIISDWCERDIRLVSITQQLDLSGTIGKMIATVLFGVAEIEREYLRERQELGISRAKARGVYTGRQKGTTKADPNRAKELKAKGLKNREIATALGVSLPTVTAYLKL